MGHRTAKTFPALVSVDPDDVERRLAQWCAAQVPVVDTKAKLRAALDAMTAADWRTNVTNFLVGMIGFTDP